MRSYLINTNLVWLALNKEVEWRKIAIILVDWSCYIWYYNETLDEDYPNCSQSKNAIATVLASFVLKWKLY